MNSLNRATLIGRLGKDPEIRRLENDNMVANLSIATSEKWTDRKTGEKREKTEWHKVTVWGKLAGICEEYVHKGSLVLVEGKIETRKWQGKNGQDRYTTEVVLSGFDSQLIMLGGKGEGGGGGGGGQRQDQDYQSPQQDHSSGQSTAGAPDDFDDDIPF